MSAMSRAGVLSVMKASTKRRRAWGPASDFEDTSTRIQRVVAAIRVRLQCAPKVREEELGSIPFVRPGRVEHDSILTQNRLFEIDPA